MSRGKSGSVRSVGVWFPPLGVFALLAALTGAIWQQQVNHQRQLLTRHTEDVCAQASRRAEVYFASDLSVAEVSAKHWATHGPSDRSRARFEQFGAVLIQEREGYHAVALLDTAGRAQWVVPADNRTVPAFLASGASSLLADTKRSQQPVMSPPVQSGDKRVSMFGILPLQHGAEALGYLVFEFRADPLFADLFHERIRSEFSFRIDDGDQTVFRHDPDVAAAASRQGSVRSARTFNVWNRRWRMTVLPRPAGTLQPSWAVRILIPSFGVALSIGLSVLIYLLGLRLRAYRRARDEAVQEVAERRRAEEALRASEARYRSVFDSATDGLVVFHLDGRIEEANAAACAMHGYDEGELDATHVRDLIADDYQHKYDEFMAQMDDRGATSLDSVDVCQDGRRLDVEIHGTHFTHQGKPAVLAVFANVTERRMAQKLQVRLSRQVLVAQEEERARLSRDLHDGLGQTLTALRFELDWLGKKPKSDSPPAPPSFAQANQLLESSVEELRRMCKGLRPPLLDDLGLEPAVRQLVQEFRDYAAVDADLLVDFPDEQSPLAPEVALCAYRVLQEALTNVHRHAKAKQVSIGIVCNDAELAMSVYDDGRGFDPADQSALSHFGITGMRERAKLVNGSIELRSVPHQGTRVKLRVPRTISAALERP